MPHRLLAGSYDTPVTALHTDSRQVQRSQAFIAIKGHAQDGHAYVEQVMQKDASVVFVQEGFQTDTLANRFPAATIVALPDTAKACGLLASAFYDHPSAQLKVVAVTGTNGKTTVATLLYRLFRALGHPAGLLSTVENIIGPEGSEEIVIPAKLTTPDPISMQALMRQMANAGCRFCFMEASSHAIVQERLAGVQLDGAMFTNITHDHLDYHGTFTQYIWAKKKLFDDLPAQAFALVNADDKRGAVMLQNCRGSHHTFALQSPATFRAQILSDSFEGLHLRIGGHEVWFRLSGRFNAYNLLAIYGAALLLGQPEEKVLKAMSALAPAKGRFESMHSADHVRAIIDYAHTPDALQNVLDTILSIRKEGEKIVTVVGCGGDRDRTKRPEMARIAALASNHCIFTSDNPRSENPQDILEQMLQGVPEEKSAQITTIPNRKEAIHFACLSAQPGDIILVAGKGHETYQEIAGVRHHFDDREVVLEAFQKRNHQEIQTS